MNEAMSHGGGHEKRDITFRPIVWAAVGGLIGTLLVFLMIRVVFKHYMTREAELSPPANPLAGTYGRQVPPAPRLQTDPLRDLRRLRAAEDTVLSSYGWVDRAAGTVRMPIDRAMEILAQRGLPTRPQQASPPTVAGDAEGEPRGANR